MLLKSMYGNSVIRTEDLSAIYRLKNDKTGKLVKVIALQFKSGKEVQIACRNLKETKELFDIISTAMEQDYNLIFKCNKL